MNCDCIKDIQIKMAAFMVPKAGEDAEARVMNTALMLTDTSLVSVLQIPFRIKGNKKGYTSEKGKEIGCNASHCPFCGRATGRYEVGQDAALDALAATQSGKADTAGGGGE